MYALRDWHYFLVVDPDKRPSRCKGDRLSERRRDALADWEIGKQTQGKAEQERRHYKVADSGRIGMGLATFATERCEAIPA
jgi:hypothetical protein